MVKGGRQAEVSRIHHAGRVAPRDRLHHSAMNAPPFARAMAGNLQGAARQEKAVETCGSADLMTLVASIMRHPWVFLVLLLNGCADDRTVDANGNVPFAAVMANLDDYDGKEVRLITYASLEFEGQAAYLTKGDYENMIFINGLWLSLPEDIDESMLDKRGVYSIKGIIDLSNKGHFGLRIGSIDVLAIDEYLVFDKSENAEQGDSGGVPFRGTPDS